MKRLMIRGSIITLAFFSISIIALGLIPHRTCACGAIEDGTQLTRIINGISEKITGKRVFKKPEQSIK